MKDQIYTVKVDEFGTFWYKDVECVVLHREDGPAIEYTNGNKLYYIDGKLHRDDGPAIERADGYKAYYIHSKHYSEQDYWKEINKSSCSNKIVEIDGKKYKLVEIKE